jgi:hypothetical protein
MKKAEKLWNVVHSHGRLSIRAMVMQPNLDIATVIQIVSGDLGMKEVSTVDWRTRTAGRWCVYPIFIVG